MFLDSWQDLLRVTVLGALAYLALVLLLRISGKRTLSKWNAFDLIVTIALGSTLATILLSSEVSYLEGVLALGLLILLQFLITWLSLRWSWIRRLVKAEPQYLYRDGRFLIETLTRQRVTEAEVRAAVRGAGFVAMEDIAAVVLETDGSVSVLRRSSSGATSALRDVR
jgi:uncharacterized membrane protein YcaP (DUF421 family)